MKLSTKSILLFLVISVCTGVVGVLSHDAYQRQWVMKNCPTPDHPFKDYYPTFRSHQSCPTWSTDHKVPKKLLRKYLGLSKDR